MEHYGFGVNRKMNTKNPLDLIGPGVTDEYYISQPFSKAAFASASV